MAISEPCFTRKKRLSNENDAKSESFKMFKKLKNKNISTRHRSPLYYKIRELKIILALHAMKKTLHFKNYIGYILVKSLQLRIDYNLSLYSEMKI